MQIIVRGIEASYPVRTRILLARHKGMSKPVTGLDFHIQLQFTSRNFLRDVLRVEMKQDVPRLLETLQGIPDRGHGARSESPDATVLQERLGGERNTRLALAGGLARVLCGVLHFLHRTDGLWRRYPGLISIVAFIITIRLVALVYRRLGFDRPSAILILSHM